MKALGVVSWRAKGLLHWEYRGRRVSQRPLGDRYSCFDGGVYLGPAGTERAFRFLLRSWTDRR